MLGITQLNKTKQQQQEQEQEQHLPALFRRVDNSIEEAEAALGYAGDIAALSSSDSAQLIGQQLEPHSLSLMGSLSFSVFL